MANENILPESTVGNKNKSKKLTFASRKDSYGMGLYKLFPKERSSWECMIDRCYNAKKKKHEQWGGRGIKVDDRWKSFKTFLADMGPRPKGCSLDRIDNDKGYSKENCRWADQRTQTRNTRKNRKITIDGVTKCVSEWAEVVGISPATIHSRLWYGWPEIKAVLEPISQAHLNGRQNRRAA